MHLSSLLPAPTLSPQPGSINATVPPALGHLCRLVQLPGWPAERLSDNGNRRGLIRQHWMLLASYSYLFRGRLPPTGLADQVRSLRNAYRREDDLPGAGNLTVTLAVLAACGEDLAAAVGFLDDAAAYYGVNEAGRLPGASGQALLVSAGSLIRRASTMPQRRDRVTP